MEESRFAKRMQNVAGNVIRELLKLTQQPDIISFAGGMPAVESFPSELLADIASDVLRKDKSILQYGTTEGLWPLREYIAHWVKDIGIVASPSDVLITSGSQQGIDLLSKAMLDPGEKVVVESPTYLAAIQIFKTYEASFLVAHGDNNGVNVDELDEIIRHEKPKIVYLVPTFQNPTGITMSLERRQEIGKMLAKHQVVFVEDDPYGRLRYAGIALPSIKSFDASNQVTYVGSFSKIVSPGIRVGFTIAPAPLLRKMVIGKQGTDVHTSNLSQALVYEFCRRGLIAPHLASINAMYTRKLAVMKECLKMFPDNIKWTSPEGGLFIWGVLPEGINAAKLLEASLKEKVAFIPGETFFVEGGHQNTIRLNFSHASEELIREGMGRLARVYATFI
ncbi:MAG: PLP-dependent aminotransferase family protein [bacterium]|nr:PLP-dependent aminotransferase family protein [bacterium]